MFESVQHKMMFFSPVDSGSGNQAPAKKRNALKTNKEQAAYIEELEKLNFELREARRAAFNLLEDAVQSKEKLRETEQKYRAKLEQEVLDSTGELKKSQHQYVSLVENTPDLISRWNKFLKLVYANTAFADKTGSRLKDLYGKDNLEMGKPGDISVSYMDSLRKVFETGEAVEHYSSFPTTDGEVFYYSRIVPEKNEKGEVETVLSTARDITGLKKAEQQVLQLKDEIAAQATDKYLQLFNSIDEGFCIIEMIFDERQEAIDYRFLETNPAFVNQTSLRNVIGKRMKELAPKHENFWFSIYGEVAKTGESKRFEHYASQLGEGAWYEVYAFRVDAPEKHHVATLFNDITERKKTEEHLKQFNVTLEQKVTGRTKDLKESEIRVTELNRSLIEANKVLNAMNSELKAFTNVAASTYVETLRHLYINLEMIVTNDARNLSNSGRANLRRAQGAIQKMKLVTDDLISFSKLHEIGRKEDGIDLNSILQGAVNEFLNKSDHPAVEILCDHLPVISGYPLLLPVLFHHMLDNAIKFRKGDKDHVIHVTCAESVSGDEIKIDAAEKNVNYTVISFEDNGVGFPQQEAEKIFDMFYQLHEKGKYKGSGTGLAICKKIMEMHGGFISAKGKPDEGAVFSCYFPPPATDNELV